MHVASVLDLCPYLQHLKYAASCDFQSCLGNIDPDKGHPLLSLDVDCSTINSRSLTPVLMKCARIRRLIVVGADLPTIDTINQYCSNLILLGFDTSTVPQLTEEQCTVRPNGLRTLRTPLYKVYGADTWMPLIKSHQSTMEHLAVKFHYDSRDPKKDVRKYKGLRFQKLQSLASSFFINAQEIFLPAIKNLDTITELSVTCSSNWQELVDAILGLRNLRRLIIADTPKQRRNYSSELVQLFRGWHQSNDERRSLEHVEIRHCTFVADEVLLHLAAISTLKEVVLNNCISHTAYGLQSFLKKLKEHKHIMSVVLVDMVMLEDSALRILGEIDRLRSIELKSCDKITDTGVQDMAAAIAETRDCMEKLIVHKCPRVSWKGTQTIAETFSNYRFISSYKKSTIKSLADH
ncbi:hypothetical protein BJV82DRAFT_271934 [Fennellomyces sp. T-0311]|nr:hypothetical protein BJV82DRAFT_271934 [Fennellomyces sp. T-0311]